MPGDCWIGRESVVRTHYRPIGFGRERREALLSVAIMEHSRSMVKSEAENGMEAEI